MEHRVQVLELAAFLDRLDRARDRRRRRLPAALDPRGLARGALVDGNGQRCSACR